MTANQITRRHERGRPRLAGRLVDLLVVATLLVVTHGVDADTVLLRGSSIPLQSCTVDEIRSGRLYFRDAGGRRQRRELEEVAAIGFAGLPDLDEAELQLAEGDSAGAVRHLLRALIALDANGTSGGSTGGSAGGSTGKRTDRDLVRLWLHVRLARVHDARGEFVEAAGHTATVLAMRGEAYWRHLEPLSRPRESTYPAAVEAMYRLRQARRTLRSPTLIAVVDRLTERVAPIHDRLRRDYDGPAIDAERTYSGITIDAIRDDGFEIAGARHAAGGGPTTRPAGNGARARSVPEKTIAAGTPSGRVASRASRAADLDRPDAIEALIATGQTDEALVRCRRIEQHPGDRSLARFLYQYGRVLQVADDSSEAAVMFMRSAVLFPGSPFAAPCLLHAAAIYRDGFGDRETARRLAEGAAAVAKAQGQAEMLERAQRILDTLGPATP